MLPSVSDPEVADRSRLRRGTNTSKWWQWAESFFPPPGECLLKNERVGVFVGFFFKEVIMMCSNACGKDPFEILEERWKTGERRDGQWQHVLKKRRKEEIGNRDGGIILVGGQSIVRACAPTRSLLIALPSP